MNNDQFCDGCSVLEYMPPVNRYDYHAASCCDPDKPAMGVRRVVAVSSIGKPFQILRPVWCRGKQKADQEPTP